jgi:hypothetical protein
MAFPEKFDTLNLPKKGGQMHNLFAVILLISISSTLFAKASTSHWYLGYGVPGGKETKVELDNNRHDFKNAIGQECWVTSIIPQRSAEERGIGCKIDSKNMVTTSFACWNPYEELKQRSFATSKLKSDGKSYDTAHVILTCHKKSLGTSK